MKSLIVEDDFGSRRLLQTYVQELGPTDVVVDGEEAIEAFRGVLGHLCCVLEVLSYERTRSTAFHTQAVPSLLTTGEGTLLEVNDAFRKFFALPGEARIEEQHLSAFFSFHAGEGLQALLKRDSLARPAVAAYLPDRPRISGVLHSLAGARTPDGTRMRYFYFLPDEASTPGAGSGEAIKRSYPTLDLPEKLSLTAREIDVAVRIAAGESSKDIADRLNVSIRTVQFHRQSLRDKLGIVGRGLSLRHALLRYERAVS
ncbi:MAG: LuxR C-terminal-related transcriptional regulator [Spirochaetaceae bacterium]